MGFGSSDGTYYENEATYQLNIPNEPDYDTAAFKASGIPPAANGHGPDTFKLPNHITFSNESKYHGVDGNEGGQWQKLDTSDDGKERWSFTPGATNFKHHTLNEMIDYFKKYEPGNVLNAEAGLKNQGDLPVGPDFSWVDQTPEDRAAQRVRAGVQTRPENSPLVNIVAPGGPFSPKRILQGINDSIQTGADLTQEAVQGTLDVNSDETLGRVLSAAGLGTSTIATGGVAQALETGAIRQGLRPEQFAGGAIEQRGLSEFRRALESPRGESGSLERQGSNTFNREVRRSPADGTFRSRAEMEQHWDEFMTNRRTGVRGSASERAAIDEEANARYEYYLRQNPNLPAPPPPRQTYTGDTTTLRRQIEEVTGIPSNQAEAALNRLRDIWERETSVPTQYSYGDGLKKFVSGTIPFSTKAGKKGFVGYTYDPQAKDIYVDRIGGKTMFGSQAISPHEFGFKETRQLFKDLADAHPDAETISGFRVSGARKANSGHAGDAKMRIPGRGQPILDLEAAE